MHFLIERIKCCRDFYTMLFSYIQQLSLWASHQGGCHTKKFVNAFSHLANNILTWILEFQFIFFHEVDYYYSWYFLEIPLTWQNHVSGVRQLIIYIVYVMSKMSISSRAPPPTIATFFIYFLLEFGLIPTKKSIYKKKKRLHYYFYVKY